MFDRTTYVAPPSTNIDVRQQPNDAADAARLYGECRAKAESEVRDATIVRLGALNEVTAVKIASQTTFHDMKLHVRLLFKINGESFDIHVEDNHEAMTRAVYEGIVARLFEKVTTKLVGYSLQHS
jgi:hypothetical protein